jgi:hypothetical protein
MSQLAQKRRFEGRPITSGLRPTPDILSVRRHVSKVPIADVGIANIETVNSNVDFFSQNIVDRDGDARPVDAAALRRACRESKRG